MCFLFGRSTGPISIPPPVYYADIACERSRCYGDFDDDMSDTSSTIGDDRGKPQRNRGGTQPTQRGHGTGPSTYGTQGPSKPDRNTPGPSKGTPNKQGSGYTAPGKPLRPTEGKQPDMMAGLSKKEKARLFEERIAANQQATKEGSSKVEGKKAEAKPEPKAKEKVPEEKTGGTKPEGEVKQLKVEGKKPETQTPKEKAKVEINALLKDKMFYV